MVSAGKCSNCGKDGATKSCTPCKADDDVRVWYCDVSCQKTHWKEHKKVCLSIAKNKQIHDYLSIGKPVESRRDMKKILHKSSSCLYCNGPAQTTRKCSRCKSALYCSVECQKNDWSRHKTKCDAIVKGERTVIKEMNMINQNAMLKQWKEVSPFAFTQMICTTLSKKQLTEQPPTNVVSVTVDFNWNYRTFLPVEGPECEPISMLPDHVKQAVQMQLQQSINRPNRPANTASHILFIFFNGIPTLKPMDIQYLRVKADKELLDATLKSNTIDIPVCPLRLWSSKLHENLRQQATTLKDQAGENWTAFIFHAFQLYTTKPRHKTHCILVKFEFGFGLGKIAKLSSFEVVTLAKARQLLSVKFSKKSTMDKETLLRDVLDVENSPKLIASRQTYPNNVLLPILFVNYDAQFVYASPNLSQYDPKNIKGIVSVKVAARQASGYFDILSNVAKNLPNVDSPDLN